MPWAVKCRSECQLDGKREHLAGRFRPNVPEAPLHLAGYNTMMFKTRATARAFIDVYYGYIRKCPDLRREPHGLKMPVAVKVKVTIEEVSS